jgi:hypothetical protein
MIDPRPALAVISRSPAAYLGLIRAGGMLGFDPSSPDDTLQGREAGVNPAQSRYGDHRLDRTAIEQRDGSPVADPAVAARPSRERVGTAMRSPG